MLWISHVACIAHAYVSCMAVAPLPSTGTSPPPKVNTEDELAAEADVDQTKDGFVLCDTLLTEVTGFIDGVNARKRRSVERSARNRRSFDDLSLTNEGDRATLRQHVPLFSTYSEPLRILKYYVMQIIM